MSRILDAALASINRSEDMGDGRTTDSKDEGIRNLRLLGFLRSAAFTRYCDECLRLCRPLLLSGSVSDRAPQGLVLPAVRHLAIRLRAEGMEPGSSMSLFDAITLGLDYQAPTSLVPVINSRKEYGQLSNDTSMDRPVSSNHERVAVFKDGV